MTYQGTSPVPSITTKIPTKRYGGFWSPRVAEIESNVYDGNGQVLYTVVRPATQQESDSCWRDEGFGRQRVAEADEPPDLSWLTDD